MSMIDCFKHEVIGYCTNGTPLYRLLEDVSKHVKDFQGKSGDILLGGGGGESSAIRFSIPELFNWHRGYDSSKGLDFFGDVVQAYWSPTDSYLFGVEFANMGWDHNEMPIETWLTEHLTSFLLKHEKEYYKKEIEGIDDWDLEEECDGSIFTKNYPL